MSAGVGPGRTGSDPVIQRYVSDLTRTAAAAVLGTGLPDGARARSYAKLAHLGSQDGSGRHPGGEWLDDCGLGW